MNERMKVLMISSSQGGHNIYIYVEGTDWIKTSDLPSIWYSIETLQLWFPYQTYGQTAPQ